MVDDNDFDDDNYMGIMITMVSPHGDGGVGAILDEEC